MGKKAKKNEKKKIIKKENENNNLQSIETNKNDNINELNESLNKKDDKNFNKISKLIENELTQNLMSEEIIKKSNYRTSEKLYKSLQNNYLKNNLNINIISMITKLINTSNTISKTLKSNYPLNDLLTLNLIEIVKELLLTDLEIVYFSLYLDIYGWENKYFDLKDNLILTALSVKKYLNEDIDIIETHLSENYEYVKEKFANWIQSQRD